jgi:hypothetical protein
MAEWSKDHVAPIGSQKIQNYGLSSGAWLKWRPGGAIRGKGRQLVGKVGVTPHVSKPHDYVNHMFMRP